MKNLLILGAGVHGHVVAETARAMKDSTISPSATLMPSCIVEPRAVVGCGSTIVRQRF